MELYPASFFLMALITSKIVLKMATKRPRFFACKYVARKIPSTFSAALYVIHVGES